MDKQSSLLCFQYVLGLFQNTAFALGSLAPQHADFFRPAANPQADSAALEISQQPSLRPIPLLSFVFSIFWGYSVIGRVHLFNWAKF
jgi:hypothetical protein